MLYPGLRRNDGVQRPCLHSRIDGNPVVGKRERVIWKRGIPWFPAFAGMTEPIVKWHRLIALFDKH